MRKRTRNLRRRTKRRKRRGGDGLTGKDMNSSRKWDWLTNRFSRKNKTDIPKESFFSRWTRRKSPVPTTNVLTEKDWAGYPGYKGFKEANIQKIMRDYGLTDLPSTSFLPDTPKPKYPWFDAWDRGEK